ncbi:hypothetical protein L1787_05485 [Acuticoccus sp. M5D2P5]|uniref:hypothetical protein n=1 Tax=Acuticoccus kalidii TaxID=2910977 RepID=UPI001F33AA43|nr:hypothetical protein [Acuticoccus kalidii]MCF3932866.1 hypothetical protein [Acuticoccus kalidii]
MTYDAFPTDIKGCMKDCILSIFWPKKDIIKFFNDHGCTSKQLEKVKNYEADNINRAGIVDAVFATLSSRADNGLGQFRAMLQALMNWSHFDPYYFEKLQKLDRKEAQKNLDHLRQLAEIRDARIKKERRDREERRKAGQSTKETLSSLRERFLEMFAERSRAQERGYKLEALLSDMAKLEEIEVTAPFKCLGEQIDGAIKYDGEHYIVEAKWHDRFASTEPLYAFAHKIDGKMYGRGIFISVNGFSKDPVDALVRALRPGGSTACPRLRPKECCGRLAAILKRCAQDGFPSGLSTPGEAPAGTARSWCGTSRTPRSCRKPLRATPRAALRPRWRSNAFWSGNRPSRRTCPTAKSATSAFSSC